MQDDHVEQPPHIDDESVAGITHPSSTQTDDGPKMDNSNFQWKDITLHDHNYARDILYQGAPFLRQHKPIIALTSRQKLWKTMSNSTWDSM